MLSGIVGNVSVNVPLGRPGGNRDRGPLGRVVEHAVAVEVDPAVERRRRARRVRRPHAHGRSRADRQHQVLGRLDQTIFVVRQRRDVVAIGPGVLSGIGLAIDPRPRNSVVCVVVMTCRGPLLASSVW